MDHVDLDTGERFWVSGSRKDGGDRLYGEPKPVDLDRLRSTLAAGTDWTR